MSRPALIVAVTGTGTDVGKTWVAAALLRLARREGLVVAARKPAQSFAPGTTATDAAVLAAATGEEPSAVCPPDRSYPVPMAPPMAAGALGLPAVPLASLVEAITASWPTPRCDMGLVEGAGGVASPLAEDGDCADMARALGAERAVLVADAALGVINSARLSAAALHPLPVVIHLNRYRAGDDLHRRNLAWLSERDGFTVTTTVPALLDAVTGGAGIGVSSA